MTSYHHITMQQSPACIQELHTDDSVWFEFPNLPEDSEAGEPYEELPDVSVPAVASGSGM